MSKFYPGDLIIGPTHEQNHSELDDYCFTLWEDGSTSNYSRDCLKE